MYFRKRKSLRRKKYDYSSPGTYFITICTKDRKHFFGEIKKGKMILNDVGSYTKKCRKDITRHHPYTDPGTFICMPNHIHGIITITNKPKQHNQTVGAKYFSSGHHQGTTGINYQQMNNNSSLPQQGKQKNGAPSGSLGSIVRGFKIGVTKYTRKYNISFERQRGYHDHIIRNKQAYINITRYIINNPRNRKEDRFR